jgi:hypothetical protein
MASVHVISLKVGSSHGLWQYKLSGTHDRVMMNGIGQILDKTCRLLGYDRADRSAVYLFYFSAEAFQGYHASLEKVREARDGGCYYTAMQSKIGDITARGLFPALINTRYLRTWPERIYFKLEKSLAGGIVN